MRITTFSGELKISFPAGFPYFESIASNSCKPCESSGSDTSNSVGSVIDSSDTSELEDSWEDPEEAAEQIIRQKAIVDETEIALVREFATILSVDPDDFMGSDLMQQIQSRSKEGPVAEAFASNKLEMPMGQVMKLPLLDRIFCLSGYIQHAADKEHQAPGETRDEFVRRLMDKVGWSRFKLEIGEPQLTKVEHARIQALFDES